MSVFIYPKAFCLHSQPEIIQRKHVISFMLKPIPEVSLQCYLHVFQMGVLRALKCETSPQFEALLGLPSFVGNVWLHKHQLENYAHGFIIASY